MKTICIDAGHGGQDPGALGPMNMRESDVTLKVALMLRDLLQGECRVIMTRSADIFVGLSMRALIANQQEADLFLSIHCNSGPAGEGTGFEVWTSPGQTESDRFATFLYQSFENKFPGKPRRFDTSDGDPDKESKFTVLVSTKMPAALMELEFIHTKAGASWLSDTVNQKACAEALADGVRDYLGLSEDLDEVPAPAKQDKLLEVEMLAIVSRAELKVKSAFEVVRTEIEALFRK